MTPTTRHDRTPDLPPIRKIMVRVHRRGGDPTSGTRQECAGAFTLDGAWSFERTEEDGTPWTIRHRPTGYRPLVIAFSNLTDARRTTAAPAIWRQMWDDALWFIDNVPELARVDGGFSDHDHARGLLTWLVDRDLGPANSPVSLDPVGVTG